MSQEREVTAGKRSAHLVPVVCYAGGAGMRLDAGVECKQSIKNHKVKLQVLQLAILLGEAPQSGQRTAPCTSELQKPRRNQCMTVTDTQQKPPLNVRLKTNSLEVTSSSSPLCVNDQIAQITTGLSLLAPPDKLCVSEFACVGSQGRSRSAEPLSTFSKARPRDPTMKWLLSCQLM